MIAAGNRFAKGNQSKVEGALDSNFYEAMIWVAKENYMNQQNSTNDNED